MGISEAIAELFVVLKLKDETGEGLENANTRWAKHGAIIGGAMTGIGVAGEKLTDRYRTIDAAAATTAISIGLPEEAVRRMINTLWSADTPLEESAGLIDALGRSGMKSEPQIMAAATAFDMLADANGANAAIMAQELIPAFNAFGIPLTEVGKHIDSITYMTRNSTITWEDFAGVTSKLGPQMHDAGLSMEDTAAILLVLEQNGYKGRNATAAFRDAVTQASKDGTGYQGVLQILNDKYGIQSGAIDTVKNNMSQAQGITERTADAQNRVVSASDKMNTEFAKATAAIGGIISPLDLMFAAFERLGPAMFTLSGLARLFPSLGTAISGFAGSIVGAIQTALSTVTGFVSGFASGVADALIEAGLMGATTMVAAIVTGVVVGMVGVGALISSGIMDAIKGIGRAVESSDIGASIMGPLKIAFAASGGAFGTLINDTVSAALAGLPKLLQGNIGGAIDAFLKSLSHVPDDMAKPFEQARDAINRSLGGVGSAFGSFVSNISGAFSDIGGAFGVMAGQLKGIFSQVMNAIKTVIDSTIQGFFIAGQNIMVSIANGIIAGAGAVITSLKDWLGKIRALFPFSPAKEGPLAQTPNWGTWITGGMDAAAPTVQASATKLATATSAGFKPSTPVQAKTGTAIGGITNSYDYSISTGAVNLSQDYNFDSMVADMERRQAMRMQATRKARGLRA